MESKEDEEITIDAKKSKISGTKQIGDLRGDQKSKIFDISENSDEEFSIDFSKVKSFFKSKGEKKPDESSKEGKKDDEEITIDFGRVKNFFKSEKTEDAHAPAKEKDDDELSFDFGKIKKFFKSEEKEAAGGDDIQVNWGKVADFFKKYGVIFIALIPIILSVYIRMQAGLLPMTDRWAADSVVNSIRAQIRASIDQQYPNLPDSNKNALVDTELQRAISQNSQQIEQRIRETSAYFKSFFQDENNRNYMPDIDPYYWFRYAKNIIEHGHPGDILKDNRPFDTRQYAPNGRFVFPDMFHPYFLAYSYKALHLLVPDLTLMRSLFYYPIFISALCVLLVFLITRKIAGNMGGLFAGVMMAVNSAFLGRTLFGHADSDAWVVFFPLLVTWLFIEAIDGKKIRGIALAGFFTGMFTSTWSGWWYVFDFLIATAAAVLAYLALADFFAAKSIKPALSNPAIRRMALAGIVYFISTAAFVTLFSGWHTFSSSFAGPFSFTSIKAPVISPTAFWPNVLTTVAELNEGSINNIINSMGGIFLFFISLLGLVLSISRSEGIKKSDFVYFIGAAVFYGILFISFGSSPPIYQSLKIYTLLAWIMLPVLARIAISIYKKDSSYDFQLPILLSLWIVSTMFASIKGVRFTLLLAPAFSVALGVAIGKSYTHLSRWLTKEFKIHKIISSGMLIAVLLLVFANPIKGAVAAAGSDIPIVNDAWYNALSTIKNNSGEDAIITSWWDFGHHFKALTGRRVTFDGTTQTATAAHWVGKLLMVSDEREAIGILRMLDCGSDNAFNKLFEITNDSHKALKILNKVILLDRNQAQKELKALKLDSKDIEKILSFTHCSEPEAYFIASNDMIGKSGVWGHFGSWNFERADIWQNARKMPQEEAVSYMIRKFNHTKERAENIYFEVQSIESDNEANAWIAPWPSYAGLTDCVRNDKSTKMYVCGNGLQVNLSNYDVFGIGQQGIVRPKTAAFTSKDGLFRKEFEGATLDFGITLVPKSENEITGILSMKELVGGMFTRMFYMKGHGLKYFKVIDHQLVFPGSQLETDIYVYKVDWEGGNATIVQDYADTLEKISKEESSEATEPINSAAGNS